MQVQGTNPLQSPSIVGRLLTDANRWFHVDWHFYSLDQDLRKTECEPEKRGFLEKPRFWAVRKS